MNNKIIIAAGGTGGHLYPGLAIARELIKKGYNPVFIVREGDTCRELLEKDDFRFFEIPIKGMPRTFSFKLVIFFFLLIKSLFYAWKLLKEIKPEAVIGMGGYISFPIVLIGRIQRIPAIIHEQNFIPGLSNKILFHFVNKVAVSFKESLKNFPDKKTVFTGNPTRKELFEISKNDSYKNLSLVDDKFTVFVFGGSQGAAKINRILIESFALMEELKENIQFLHITGKKEFDIVEKEYNDKNIPGKVLPYLHSIGEAYCVADLIICRAGATTVAELQILNKPAILIPYPFATANHQELNAKVLVDSKIAEMIREEDLNAEILAKLIISKYKNSANCNPALKIPSPMPQELIVNEVLKLACR